MQEIKELQGSDQVKGHREDWYPGRFKRELTGGVLVPYLEGTKVQERKDGVRHANT